MLLLKEGKKKYLRSGDLQTEAQRRRVRARLFPPLNKHYYQMKGGESRVPIMRSEKLLINFPDTFTKWTMEAISLPEYAVKVNGCLSNWFHAFSGIRQGCLLSPYLFTLCSEVLSRFLKKEQMAGHLKRHPV